MDLQKIRFEKANLIPEIEFAIENAIVNPRHAFFGYFLLSVDFFKTKEITTAGVNISRSGMNFYYNEDFIKKLTPNTINFLLLHETFHLLSNHIPRMKKGNFDLKLANIAQDMIINSSILEDNKLCFNSKNERVVDFIADGFLIPESYNGNWVFEDLYEWLIEKDQQNQNKQNKQNSDNQNQNQQNSDNQNQNQQNSSNQKTRMTDKELENALNNYKEFDSHLLDEIPEQFKKELIKEIFEKIKHNQHNRGIMTGSFEVILERLNKRRHSYFEILNSSIKSMVGDKKEKTFSRPNRRQIPTKGKKKEEKILNVLLDTSGSMENEFEKVLSYIFKQNIIINLIQCDSSVKDFRKIESHNQFRKLKIKGLGGTTLQPGFDFIFNNKKLNKFDIVVLTDGYTDTINIDKQFKRKILVLTTSKNIDFSDSKNVQQIKIVN